MPIAPLNKWVARTLYVVGGYVLKMFLDKSAGSADSKTEADDERRPLSTRCRRSQLPQPVAPGDELKLVLVVNDSLKMGKGKIGAQCAHAAVAIVEKLQELGQDALLAQWESCGQPKICLKAKDDIELRALAAAAAGLRLPIYQVQDAGRTQVAAGSRTVLAIGPSTKSLIDQVTGKLRLL